VERLIDLYTATNKPDEVKEVAGRTSEVIASFARAC